MYECWGEHKLCNKLNWEEMLSPNSDHLLKINFRFVLLLEVTCEEIYLECLKIFCLGHQKLICLVSFFLYTQYTGKPHQQSYGCHYSLIIGKS